MVFGSFWLGYAGGAGLARPALDSVTAVHPRGDRSNHPSVEKRWRGCVPITSSISDGGSGAPAPHRILIYSPADCASVRAIAARAFSVAEARHRFLPAS